MPIQNRDLAPSRVVLQNIQSLAPTELWDPDLWAWLAAPIGGEPLYRRLLESLVGVPVSRLELRDGRAARILQRILTENPCYGLEPHLVPTEGPLEPYQHGTLVVDSRGVLQVDLGELVERGQRTGKPQLLAGGVGFRADELGSVSWYPPDATAKETIDGDDRMTSEGMFLPTDSAEALRELAVLALEGDLVNHQVAGTFSGNTLVGPRADISGEAVTSGAVAVGAESIVGKRAILGHGTVLGVDCYVGADAVVMGSVILDGTIVGRGERIVDAVVSAKGQLP